MLPPESAPLLYRELVKIATHPRWSSREQVLALSGLLERLFFEVTKQEQLAFSTLFARISYAGHLYNFQSDTLRVIHSFRRTAGRVREGLEAKESDVAFGIKAMSESILVLFQAAIPEAVLEFLERHKGALKFTQSAEIWEFKARARVVALGDDPEHNCLIVIDEENPSERVRVRYGLAERNENFNPTIQVIRKIFGFPVTLNLLEVDIDRAGIYRPRVIVVEPDYLMDVSAISECFKDTGAEPYYHLVKKFLPYETTDAILLGNIANFFLDRLLNEPDAEWQTLFRETFQLAPFAYAPMSDQQVRTLSGKAQKHYVNLKQMSVDGGGLAQQGIEAANSILEPTFFSEQYGIQGRLDLFYYTDEKTAIVELKSGTPFKPNSYGIQRSHFTQTLLYDLLVRSVFGKHIDPAKYILYSGVDLQQLRFAPTVAPEQWEALQLRNQLIALERLLGKIRPGDDRPPVLAKLRGASAEGKGFLQRDFALFEKVYAALSGLERKYFNAFTGFIAREQWMAKVGEEAIENGNGHAALWRSSFADKQQAFSILSHLDIIENRADQPDPTIIFRKTALTNPLANFRIGDIAVLYPAENETETVLDHQVIKCTITELGKTHVTVQLRYRQFNLKPFETESLWHLEPDMLEMGFGNMYRGLFEWAGVGVEKRNLLLASHPSPGPSPKGEGGLAVDYGGDGGAPDGKMEEGGDEVMEKKMGAYGQPQETTTAERWAFLKDFARRMRKKQTHAESVLWEHLQTQKLLDFKFRRQHIIENYITDFVCLELRLVVEVDGTIHDDQEEYDEIRTEFLNLCGFEVIRFKNEDVLNRTLATLDNLKTILKNRKAELNLLSQSSESLTQVQPTSLQSIEHPIQGHSPLLQSAENPNQTHSTSTQANGNPNQIPSQAPLPPGGGAGGGVLTPEQTQIFQKITQSQSYFLLWGPPGTGKTSVMLRALADWVLHETTDNLLLLAYTNRAVDEICEALDSLGGNIREQYLRIGSRFSTAERFRAQLLNVQIAGVGTRAELRAILESRRIFVSTVASFSQNDNLLRLKKFQRLVVDEASQLLEPQIIGLLTRFDHFVLIGDHRQLPAVTAQGPEATIVEDPELQGIGLQDMRDSYFERLYRRCETQGWHWAYARLSHQGRMHADIMEFPNRTFYGDFLKTLPQEHEGEAHSQHAGLWYKMPGDTPDFERIFASQRVVFMPAGPEDALPGQKTSRAEAELATRLVLFFQKLFAANEMPWLPTKTLGIITPWRAQIAQVRECLATAGLDPDELTIDTVERYQGGARDIIILSCCVHSVSQLASLVSLSGEGVDRKLNVALTRARRHVIVLGNPQILREDERYRTFIEQYGV